MFVGALAFIVSMTSDTVDPTGPGIMVVVAGAIIGALALFSGSARTAVSSTQTAAEADEPAPTADWYADPTSRFEQRYWDGNTWTEHVSNADQTLVDPDGAP